MVPMKGNAIWEVPLIVHLPHELPPVVNKYEFKYDDNGDWDGDYNFYAVEVPDCVEEVGDIDKLNMLLALEDSYRYSLRIEVSGEFDESNQRWVIHTTKEPLRLLTDKERKKLPEKSSYFGDGDELIYI